jgi:plastocyanin
MSQHHVAADGAWNGSDAERSGHMRGSQRYLWISVALLLIGAIALATGRGHGTGTAAQRVAQRDPNPTATATDLPPPTTTTPFFQIVVTLGPTPAVLPGDSSAVTPTPLLASPTNTPVPPTPTATTVPPTATATATTVPPTVITIENTTPPGAFTPQTRTVPHGSTVIWHNNTGLTHTATSVAGPASFDTGLIAPGSDSTAIMFNTPGTYQYHCSIHPSMMGTIIVT